MKRLVVMIGVLGAALAVAGCKGCSRKTEPRRAGYQGSRVDAHTHLSRRALAEALRLMQKHGVTHAINVSGGFPGAGLERSLAAARQSRGRLFVLCNLPWAAYARRPDFPEIAVRLLERCQALGAKGLKIEKGLGLGYRDPLGRRLAVDDPRLDPIFRAAGRLGLPVLIHTGDPKAFWLPVNKQNERYEELQVHPGWSIAGRDVPSWSKLWEEFARRVRRHPQTTFVGAHFGNAPEEPERVARLLGECPNLMVDTAARVPELGRQPPAKLRRLFIKFQDRILFATDLGVGLDEITLGTSGAEPPSKKDIRRFFSATWRFFETGDQNFPHPTPIQGRWRISGIHLPPAVLKKLYRDNAVRVFGLAL